jgi:hypothetical protein
MLVWVLECGKRSLQVTLCSRIHPWDKQDEAYRLSLGERAVAYGEKGVSLNSHIIEVSLIAVVVMFTYV